MKKILILASMFLFLMTGLGQATTPTIQEIGSMATQAEKISKDIATPKININTADISVLQTIKGIGPKIAQMIVDYRKSQPFTSVDDLLNIKGIGEKTLAKIKEFITVK